VFLGFISFFFLFFLSLQMWNYFTIILDLTIMNNNK
jgi:hypothetical protein